MESFVAYLSEAEPQQIHDSEESEEEETWNKGNLCTNGFEGVIGSSPALKKVLAMVQTVASSQTTVLIEGETGTGKELIARSIHSHSPRKSGAFVAVNSAAIPANLLESELFGHERGAFTGAACRRVGRFEAADRGTLFLDEIGDLPFDLQAKLLRVIEDRNFERLGGTHSLQVDVRLIAATHRDLGRMVQEGKFRADLYYRLNVFPISVPPLRQRRGDIPLLAQWFVSLYSRRMNKRIRTIPEGTLEAMEQYRWPGNVRELQNFIERSVILSDDWVLQAPLHDLHPLPRRSHCR